MYCMGRLIFRLFPPMCRVLELFKKAADKGYPQAQATIGALYLKGLPGLLEKDHKKGITLLSKAVRSKSLTARFNLGMAYTMGMAFQRSAQRHPSGCVLPATRTFQAQYIWAFCWRGRAE